MIRRRLGFLALVAGLLSGCDDGTPSDGGGGGSGGSPSGGGGGGGAPAPIKHKFKAIAGVSMGGIGASLVGSRNPERFDSIASLGGPLETVYMLRSFERYQMGGFCSLPELEAILAANPGNPDVLNDPAMLPCMGPTPAETGAVLPEFEQYFNDWAFTTSGGTFDRTSYLELFQDLSLALGNPFFDNPDSPSMAPGITREMAERALDECLPAVVHTGFYSKEYNPRGEYPVITFCDGEEPVYYCKDSMRKMDWCASSNPEEFCANEGGVETATKSRNKELFYQEMSVYDPCFPHQKTMVTALAVDLNRNGVRDFGEPLVNNGHERYSDVGEDGCDDAHEDGAGACVAGGGEGPGAGAAGLPDPNGDNYHWRENATGTENDWLREEGEPFEDFGVDGVDGTDDRGEGNGAFDMAPGYQSFLEHSPRLQFRNWQDAERRRMNWYVEGGIRDLFNFGIQAAHVWGDLAVAYPNEAAYYEDVVGWPGGQTEVDTFDPVAVPMNQVPRFPLFLYGNPNATPIELERGNGDHVGTPKEAVNRFLLMMRFIGSRWDGVIPDPPGDFSDFNSRAFSKTFRSEALGADRDFAIVLPPGYDAPENADVRYPVLIVGHGYGMQAAGSSGFYVSNIIYDVFMQEGQIRKMIVVYVDGNCCFVNTTTGERACTLEDEDGNERGLPTWQRECVQGSFYADREGYGPGDDYSYERHVLELLDYVDQNYRTLPPEE